MSRLILRIFLAGALALINALSAQAAPGWGPRVAAAEKKLAPETKNAGAGVEGAPFSPEEWQIRQGKWQFTPNGELLCEGTTYSSLLYRKKFLARDIDFSVEVMFLGPESSAGLVFRALGEHFYSDTSFYQLEWYTRGHHHDQRLSLMTKNPRWKQIVTPIVREAPYHKWIRFRVRAKDDLIEAFIDGERVFEKRDRTLLHAGKIGLHVFQPHKVRFRGLRLTRLGL
jgi:hypothetical protein